MMYKSHREIDPIFRTTTPIIYREEDGGGTGFYLNYDGESYLVTNRHVVAPDDISPRSARIWTRESGDLSVRNHLDLPLEARSESPWLFHPDQEDYDIAVAPIDHSLTTLGEQNSDSDQTGSLAFSPDHFVHDNLSFDSRVTVLGHPGGITGADTHFPIRRNALIASPYGTTFNGKPVFLTDARMHAGMSGGPVVIGDGWWGTSGSEVPMKRIKDDYLIGIHSETYFDVNPQSNTNEEARFDLNGTWYPRIIRAILEKI